MKIQNKDLYHGAALTQLTEHESFKALNKADSKYGHYLVNTDKRFLTKHSEKAQSPWQFTFKTDDLQTIKSDVASGFKTFLVLVCGKVSICLLNEDEINAVMDLDAQSQQWIKVKLSEGCSMEVNGSKGSLKRRIAHNKFPLQIFEL